MERDICMLKCWPLSYAQQMFPCHLLKLCCLDTRRERESESYSPRRHCLTAVKCQLPNSVSVLQVNLYLLPLRYSSMTVLVIYLLYNYYLNTQSSRPCKWICSFLIMRKSKVHHMRQRNAFEWYLKSMIKRKSQVFDFSKKEKKRKEKRIQTEKCKSQWTQFQCNYKLLLYVIMT